MMFDGGGIIPQLSPILRNILVENGDWDEVRLAISFKLFNNKSTICHYVTSLLVLMPIC